MIKLKDGEDTVFVDPATIARIEPMRANSRGKGPEFCCNLTFSDGQTKIVDEDAEVVAILVGGARLAERASVVAGGFLAGCTNSPIAVAQLERPEVRERIAKVAVSIAHDILAHAATFEAAHRAALEHAEDERAKT